MTEPTEQKSPFREARESLGLSRHQMAARIGVHYSRIAEVEQGRYRYIPTKWMESLEALGLDYAALLKAQGAYHQARHGGRALAAQTEASI